MNLAVAAWPTSQAPSLWTAQRACSVHSGAGSSCPRGFILPSKLFGGSRVGQRPGPDTPRADRGVQGGGRTSDHGGGARSRPGPSQCPGRGRALQGLAGPRQGLGCPAASALQGQAKCAGGCLCLACPARLDSSRGAARVADLAFASNGSSLSLSVFPGAGIIAPASDFGRGSSHFRATSLPGRLVFHQRD